MLLSNVKREFAKLCHKFDQKSFTTRPHLTRSNHDDGVTLTTLVLDTIPTLAASLSLSVRVLRVLPNPHHHRYYNLISSDQDHADGHVSQCICYV